ncbi:N-6 DNA methylase [Sellimonas intestinalis]|uniref:N-6 DNA methylase n=1 Tax=Sellimonas intestinalis TaxID=1653434 RepID=UPI003AB6028B
MISSKYGVVYTPPALSDFVGNLLGKILDKDEELNIRTVVDPACGEGILLHALQPYMDDDVKYVGIDVDVDIVSVIADDIHLYHNDSILPSGTRKPTADYWKKTIGDIQAIIANPPWSSEKIYAREDLESAGFALLKGQYDSYVLFIQLAYQLLQNNGYFAFILPDSLYDAQNEELRRFLATQTQIKVIARLGEKIFENVNRATTVIICKKATPTDSSETICFRLSTNERKAFLAGNGKLIDYYERGKHTVSQTRFATNTSYNFDVDTHTEEESLLQKIKKQGYSLNEIFQFGRGVEVSKSGQVTICPICKYAQGYTKKQLAEGKKACVSCGQEVDVDEHTVKKIITSEPVEGSSKIIVGEDVHRYSCRCNSYIMTGISGINYKDESLYTAPKLIVRKTGLGIYAAIDYDGHKTSQTVYILNYKDKKRSVPLEFYLGVLNSRVIYYFYLKTYGENEWKSHPYLTKQIIFDLPVAKYEGDELDDRIVELVKMINSADQYDHRRDVELEKLIFKKYGLTKEETEIIISEMNSLPELSSINDMKIKDIEYV